LAIVVGIFLSLCFWFFGQSFGDIYSGVAPDLNSGPLFILLGLAIFSFNNFDDYLTIIGSRVSDWILGKPNLNSGTAVGSYSEDSLLKLHE
jgi:hypothetical protein